SLITSYKTEVYRNPYDDDAFEPTTALKLTEQQQIAIIPIKEDIANNTHEGFLLHGDTGSGKTEIYFQAIQDGINKGEEVSVLVPESSLPPQKVKRLKGRLRSNVAVLHSALSAGEK